MALNVIEESEYWYKEGLPFKCTECGRCCTGAPGYTWVSKSEITRIANYLKISEKDFGKQYLRFVDGRYALKEHPITYDCVFLKGNKCQIYGERPIQCRTFPFWPQNLKSEKTWKEVASQCEGITVHAPLIPFEEIETARKKMEEEDI